MWMQRAKDAEAIRKLAAAIISQNQTRDYVYFASMAECIGDEETAKALKGFDRRCPQADGGSALDRLLHRLHDPMPGDLNDMTPTEYKQIDALWENWFRVVEICQQKGGEVFNRMEPRDLENMAVRSERQNSQRDREQER